MTVFATAPYARSAAAGRQTAGNHWENIVPMFAAWLEHVRWKLECGKAEDGMICRRGTVATGKQQLSESNPNPQVEADSALRGHVQGSNNLIELSV